jgi:hypothetical protein
MHQASVLSSSGECINKLQEAVSRRRRINKSSLAAQYDTVAAAWWSFRRICV